MRRNLLCALIIILFSITSAFANDLDDFTEPLAIDYSQAAQLPVTGWLTKALPDGRNVTIYIAPEASIRTYFTVIAVPDHVEDVQEFLDDAGWVNLMDDLGEAFIALEPGEDGWGDPVSEQGYINAAMNIARSGRNAHDIPVFSSFGEFYLVGYGAGGSALELWAAANPILVISQVYTDGAADSEALAAAGGALYDGTNTSGFDRGLDAEQFERILRRTRMQQIARKDIPVPTWLINHTGSEEYWLAANDCLKNSDGYGIHWQRKDSTRAQTLYANSIMTGEHGFSQVRIFDNETEADAEEIYEWLSQYTRYDVTFAYSNALMPRLNYTSARVEAQRGAMTGEAIRTYETKEQKIDILGESEIYIPEHGTVQVGIFAYNNRKEPREYIVYIPEGYESEKLPVLFVYPGNTQTDSIFFDCTMWHEIAEREGIALVFVCESYSSAVSVTHIEPYQYHAAMMEILRRDVDGKAAQLDFTRIYGTGQSMGSMVTQDMARTAPELFAAVASTSGNTFAVNDLTFGSGASSDKPCPVMMITGQSDLPGLMPDITSQALTTWADYFLTVNLGRTLMTRSDDFGADDYCFLNRRTELFTWKNHNNIPVFSWGQTLMRAHNCSPAEMPILWEFMKHFSRRDDGTRYYSPSGFLREDDSVRIF